MVQLGHIKKVYVLYEMPLASSSLCIFHVFMWARPEPERWKLRNEKMRQANTGDTEEGKTRERIRNKEEPETQCGYDI